MPVYLYTCLLFQNFNRDIFHNVKCTRKIFSFSWGIKIYILRFPMPHKFSVKEN